MIFHPSSNQRGERDLAEAEKKKKKGGEIHSAKAHRCVDKVGAKGHDESSAWAICTASMGKEAVYAKGHGGSARPKRKVRENAELDAEAEAILAEYNPCHEPGGSGKGGQFSGKGSCSDSTSKPSLLSRMASKVKRAFGSPPVTGGAGFSMPTPSDRPQGRAKLEPGDVRVKAPRAHDADKVAHRQALQKGRDIDTPRRSAEDEEILRRSNERTRAWEDERKRAAAFKRDVKIQMVQRSDKASSARTKAQVEEHVRRLRTDPKYRKKKEREKAYRLRHIL